MKLRRRCPLWVSHQSPVLTMNPVYCETMLNLIRETLLWCSKLCGYTAWCNTAFHSDTSIHPETNVSEGSIGSTMPSEPLMWCTHTDASQCKTTYCLLPHNLTLCHTRHSKHQAEPGIEGHLGLTVCANDHVWQVSRLGTWVSLFFFSSDVLIFLACVSWSCPRVSKNELNCSNSQGE